MRCRTRMLSQIKADLRLWHRQNTRWGSSNTPFTRWLPAEYQDNATLPKGWDHNLKVNNQIMPMVIKFRICSRYEHVEEKWPVHSGPRSSPIRCPFAALQVREVSNRILRTANSQVDSDPLYTHLVTIFGQWTDHDLTFTPHSPVIRSFSNGIDCEESCARTEPCFPIEVTWNAALARARKLSLHTGNTPAVSTGPQERPALHPPLREVHAFLPLGAHLRFWQHGLHVRQTQRAAADQHPHGLHRRGSGVRRRRRQGPLPARPHLR